MGSKGKLKLNDRMHVNSVPVPMLTAKVLDTYTHESSIPVGLIRYVNAIVGFSQSLT